LSHEVITGETKNHHLVFIGLVKLLPVGVLWGIATFGGNVENDYFLPLELRHGYGLSVQRVDCELIKTGG
jgi:hypothetical protein